jgi:hypothetical protein
VTSDEPVTAPLRDRGLAGLTSPDWDVVDARHVRLRAERSNQGDGRVYTITIDATAAAGGTSSRTVSVLVLRQAVTSAPSSSRRVSVIDGLLCGRPAMPGPITTVECRRSLGKNFRSIFESSL